MSSAPVNNLLARWLEAFDGGTDLSARDPEHDHPFALPELDPDIAHRAPDVVVQQPLELLPVPALEHDLAQLQQDARLRQLGLRSVAYVVGGEGRRGHPPSLPAFGLAEATAPSAVVYVRIRT